MSDADKVQKVRVVVWTPCSVLTVFGCGGLLALVLFSMCVAATVDAPGAPSQPPRSSAGR